MSATPVASPRPPAARLWLQAVRAYSFPASIVPCLVGAAFVASSSGPASWALLPLVVMAGVALHVAVNLVNDAVDFQRGVDNPTAQGGSGVLVAGWTTPRAMWIAAWIAVAAAALVAAPLLWLRGTPLLLIAAIGAVGGLAYTAPPLSLKYWALGEVAVFLLMGPLMVAGAALAIGGAIPHGVWSASAPVGFLVAAILAANNQRDLVDDGKLKVRTVATVFGANAARAVTVGLVVAAYLSVPALVLTHMVPATALVVLLTLPLAVAPLRKVLAAGPGAVAQKGMVEQIAALHMAFGCAYALGLVATRFLA